MNSELDKAHDAMLDALSWLQKAEGGRLSDSRRRRAQKALWRVLEPVIEERRKDPARTIGLPRLRDSD